MIFLIIILLARFFLYIYATMMIPNKRILTSILLLIISITAVAQEDVPPAPEARGGPPGPPGFPIDDNLIFLFAAAVIYGAYISFKLLKKKTEV